MVNQIIQISKKILTWVIKLLAVLCVVVVEGGIRVNIQFVLQGGTAKTERG